MVGAGLRLLNIGKQPLWSDEAFSVWMASHSVADIIRLTIEIDQHPPLYHILLHAWMSIGGHGEAWVRSLSALFGILTIIVIYFLGKTLCGPLAGLLAALVLGLSPFHIQYAQEARSYALVAFCASLSILMTARLLLNNHERTPTIGAWLGYMLFTALTVLAHNTAVFLPVGINLFVFGLMLYRKSSLAKEGQMQAPSLRTWFFAQVGVFLFWSPWLVPFTYQAAGVAGDFWIQPPDAEVVLNALKTFLMAYLPDRIHWQGIIWAGFAGAIWMAFREFRSRAGHFLFLAALFLTPFLGELLVSLVRPIFYDRTLIWSTIPLYVLIAAGISRLRYKTYIFTALIIFVTLSWLSIGSYFQNYEKERWDLAAAYVSENVQKGDIVIFNAGWAEIPFDYYFAPFNHSVEEYGAPETMFENGVFEPHMTESDVPRLRSIIQGRRRVWLVYSHNWWTDPESLVAKVLSSNLRLVEKKNFTDIQIHLYQAH